MKILALDTSASPVSVALTDEGRLLGEYFLNVRITHSQTLMPMVEQLLKACRVAIDEIDVFAVNAGPGSFTGVRIGTASVKGMAMPLQRPCAAVSTLEAMAYGLPYEEGLVCGVMDARCGQVYNGLFRRQGDSIERLTPDRALSVEALGEELAQYQERIYLVGDGAELCWKTFEGLSLPVVLVPENLRFQRAYGTAVAGAKMAQEQKLTDPDRLMPLYLRLPQAERELKAKLAKSSERTEET